MATRTTTAAGRPTHVHGRGCPGQGVAFTDRQLEDAYAYHREHFEAQLAHQLAAHKPREALRRPDWWWRFAEAAAAWWADPERWARPTDWIVNPKTVPELWIRQGIAARRVEQLARVRFLVAEGHAYPWELEHALARGAASEAGPYFQAEARVVREALAARKAAT